MSPTVSIDLSSRSDEATHASVYPDRLSVGIPEAKVPAVLLVQAPRLDCLGNSQRPLIQRPADNRRSQMGMQFFCLGQVANINGGGHAARSDDGNAQFAQSDQIVDRGLI